MATTGDGHFDVVVTADGAQLTLALTSKEAADRLVAAVTAAAKDRVPYVFELPHGERQIVNFALVKNTEIRVVEGTGAGINIRR